MRKLIFPLLLLAIAFSGCKSSILDDPATTIPYTIPERAYVKLTVDNSYNTTISTLIDGVQDPGPYQIRLDRHLPEGLYFYTLEVKGMESGNYSKKTLYTLLVK